MNLILINLILINFIITYVWDILNFPNTIAGIITGWLSHGRINNVTLKPPFGCSFCMIFWVSLIYLLIIGGYAILITITIALLNAILSKVMLYIILLIDGIVERVFRYFDSIVNK